uniref:Uncharacterized protein n=1 Tax=Capsaspora owczarzaki TaxID=192875 RepID=M1K4M5_9EUKA|nr:hypothetical protein [Capsaspora owczarzaki]
MRAATPCVSSIYHSTYIPNPPQLGSLILVVDWCAVRIEYNPLHIYSNLEYSIANIFQYGLYPPHTKCSHPTIHLTFHLTFRIKDPNCWSKDPNYGDLVYSYIVQLSIYQYGIFQYSIIQYSIIQYSIYHRQYIPI